MLRLTQERLKRQWTKAESARRAGLNQVTVYEIEARRFRPYPSQLAKLAEAYGFDESEAETLLEEVED
ncbi:MAG: helix-turn-helix transcriptional regulator [Actinobacteria bacterium]|nr:helix-turn-helix transcriptional regulator [Actinomycetota bacterium]